MMLPAVGQGASVPGAKLWMPQRHTPISSGLKTFQKPSQLTTARLRVRKRAPMIKPGQATTLGRLYRGGWSGQPGQRWS
jgi:hypothetical protein